MTRSQAERLIGHKELRHGPTPKGGSSEEFSAMGATLTEQYYVKEEGLSVSSVLTVRTEKATTNYVPAVALLAGNRGSTSWKLIILFCLSTGEVNGTPCGAARKRGEQKGLDTLVVHALNDDMLARVKLKGIDGDSHKQWSMWFNPIQR
ncbi:1822_t:CDS:2, partial [Ambispora leptoticha]